MAKYKIFAGLGGGFGGAQYQETIECETQDIANEYAYELACQEYESYEGLHGLADFADIEENPEGYGLEEDASDAEIEEAYIEEREGWIEYWAEYIEE